MSEEVFVNVTPRETRVAIVENGMLQEVFIERTGNQGLVGNIYKGRVCRVLPGMQAAFIDIGLERSAFLHLSNMINFNSQAINEKELSIHDFIREGQELLVQITKEPLGTKGARITAQITIPSRYVVFLPYSTDNMIGISIRIEDEEERQRLKNIVLQYTGITETIVEENQNIDKNVISESTKPSTSYNSNNYGFIIRTAAEGAPENLLCADIDFLNCLWQDIQKKATNAKLHSLVYKDLSLVLRTTRDLLGVSIDRIRIDNRQIYQKVIEFSKKFIPDLLEHIKHYSDTRPIFDFYSIDDEINKALSRKVFLKSGGYLVIDQTEAMTTIDVNTGAYVGSRNLEETIFKTNLEAAQSIARQLRLRNLGGIIIIDFIDMQESEHKRQVLRTLEKSLEPDHAKTYVSEISSLGLVQMTRKRTRESLEHILCEPCPTCRGLGMMKTVETICYEIFREIVRDAKQYETQKFLVLASQKVVANMLDEESTSVLELEALIGCVIQFQVETSYLQTRYDIIPSPIG
ncbi:MAG: Rne/Rng family ribonuclease [Thiomargarita sp.]|nr:Rne/Rng family ribonuclease [Thiomargarita sp.]